MNPYQNALTAAVCAAVDAGKAILKMYDQPVRVQYKGDRSPVTEADRAAHAIIENKLRKETPDFPILSEEGGVIPYEERCQWKCFWLVDPLDGTKEFIRRNGEFTVNIALIEKGNPLMGVIYLPCLDQLYFGLERTGAFKIENCHLLNPNRSFTTLLNVAQQLPLPGDSSANTIRVVGSRSHGSKEFDQYVDFLQSAYESVEITPAGSSLKFCLVAEGSADIYPRFGPTMEWDTAAGHLLVELSGGRVVAFRSDDPLEYNKTKLTNPSFCCFGNQHEPVIPWRIDAYE